MKRVRLHSDLVTSSRWAGALMVALIAAMLFAFTPDASAQRGRGGGRFPGGGFDREMMEAFQQRMQERRDNGGRRGRDNDDDDDDDDDDDNDRSNQQGENGSRGPAVAPIERQAGPPRVPDKSELDFELDESGRVPPFGFSNQGWPEVMQWLANLSDYSLDWQSLPSDYLDLTTERSMTVPELRDLINGRLLARGYTMLINDNVMSVTTTSNIEPSLVPRVSEDELYDRRPYDFVKVVFQLPSSIQVENAPDDIAKMLSPNARVLPLVATERVLVMDVVANLRNVSALLNEERSVGGVPREFMLRYARGETVIETLYVILGINPDQQPQQQDVRLQRQRWEVMEEIAERGGNVRSVMEGPKVYLAHNQRRNSILANAPPEEMRVIAQAIRYLDVPHGATDMAALSGGGGASEFDGRGDGAGGAGLGPQYLEKYQLITTDPDKMLVTLSEVGGLSPWTEMRTDTASKTLFVRATEEDHAKVSRLVDELDGTGRTFRVVQLRTLPADAVAGTIHQLMVGQEDEQEESSPRDWRRRRGRGRDRGREQETTFDPTKGFRVTADVEQNRLLLWANPDEFAEVQNLLTQLGEIDSGRGGAPTFRVIDTDPQTTQRLLEQLRNTWTEDNPLIINEPEGEAADSESGESGEDQTEQQTPQDRTTSGRAPGDAAANVAASFVPLSRRDAARTPTTLVAQADAVPQPSNAPQAEGGSAASGAAPASPEASGGASPSDESDAQSSASPPPVKITTTPDGRVVVSSSDPEAMMRMEELIRNLTPREAGFKVFRVKNVSASSVWYNLTDYYADELAGEEEDQPWWANIGQTDEQSGLSDRRGLRIIYDNVSNTILVSGASSAQLNEMQALIDVFDTKSSIDTVKNRRTTVIPVRYSDPEVIATALKEVYTDLLSARDRRFQSNDRNGGVSTAIARDTVLRFEETETPPVPVGFDGSLSVAVDEMSNSVIISAAEELLPTIVNMVKVLDERAKRDTRVVVYQPSTNLDVSALQATLQSMIAASGSETRQSDNRDDDRNREDDRARERENNDNNNRQFGRGGQNFGGRGAFGGRGGDRGGGGGRGGGRGGR